MKKKAERERMKVLSLGWGVQSFTLAAMSALGELESIDVAVHASTTHEHRETYRFAERWASWLEENGVKVRTVRGKSPEIRASGAKVGIFIPAYTELRGRKGRLRRQCMQRWKIYPIRRWLQAQREGKAIEIWMGISTDEALRKKPSGVQYITNRWPLIERGMSRSDCEKWLIGKGLEVPPKSSCVFCPYHSTDAWRELKARGGGDWEEALKVDERIRLARQPYTLYLHWSRKRLEEIEFGDGEKNKQMRLWDEECEGICGL